MMKKPGGGGQPGLKAVASAARFAGLKTHKRIVKNRSVLRFPDGHFRQVDTLENAVFPQNCPAACTGNLSGCCQRGLAGIFRPQKAFNPLGNGRCLLRI
jgi:hypothetical protein